MKRLLISIAVVLFAFSAVSSQDPVLSKCLAETGSDSKYLKDFRIQLGSSSAPGEGRYKAQMSLWKNTKYRFTMCNADNSKGQLILTVKNAEDQVVFSSYDAKTGKSYPFIDFECNKSGIYTLTYDFLNGQKGSGVGIVSMIR